MPNDLMLNPAATFFDDQDLPEGVCTTYLGNVHGRCSLGRYGVVVSDPKLPIRIAGIANEPVTLGEIFGEEFCIETAKISLDGLAKEGALTDDMTLESMTEKIAAQPQGYRLFLDMEASEDISAYEITVEYRDVFGGKFPDVDLVSFVEDVSVEEFKNVTVLRRFAWSKNEEERKAFEECFPSVILDQRGIFQMAIIRILRARTTDGGFYTISKEYQMGIDEWLYGDALLFDLH